MFDDLAKALKHFFSCCDKCMHNDNEEERNVSVIIIDEDNRERQELHVRNNARLIVNGGNVQVIYRNHSNNQSIEYLEPSSPVYEMKEAMPLEEVHAPPNSPIGLSEDISMPNN